MRVVVALGLLSPICSCVGPPPSHALVVRNMELKCALIAFSGCGAFASEPDSPEESYEPDAGVGDEDTGAD